MLFLRAKQAKAGKWKESYKRVKTQKWNDFRMVWTSFLWYKTININNRVSCPQKYSLLPLCCIQLLSCLMGTSVFQSVSSNWIDPVQNISPHLSTLLTFLFLFLSWINSLIWFITWTCKLLSQHNWGWHAVTRWQNWTPRGGVQVEEGTDLSMTPKISVAAVCFASWKHGLGLSQSV